MYQRLSKSPAHVAMAAACVVGVSLAGSPAAGAADAGFAAVIEEFDTVVTGTTANRIPYTRSTPDAAWTSLGGQLIGPPAVVRAANSHTYYVGLGTNNVLYVRTEASGWTRLSSTTDCGVPAVGADSTTLYVSCRGRSNGALYSGKAPLTDAPVIGSWRNLGGKLLAAPSMVVDSEFGAVHFVVGGRYTEDGFSGNVYATEEHHHEWSRVGMDCAGRPAVSYQAGSTPEQFGGLSFTCRRSNGALNFFLISPEDLRDGVINVTASGDVATALSPSGDTLRIFFQASSGAANVCTLSTTASQGCTRIVEGLFSGGMAASALVTPAPAVTSSPSKASSASQLLERLARR